MWSESFSVSSVNLEKKIYYNSRDIEFFLGGYFFGTVSSQSLRHRKMVSFPTSPIQCNYLTLGNHRTQNDQFRRKQHIVL